MLMLKVFFILVGLHTQVENIPKATEIVEGSGAPFSNSNIFYIHFFSSFFYLNITPCYNTYITYSLTDIGSKINWQFTNKNSDIAFTFTISFVCSGKRNKTVWKMRKKKVLKNENIYIKKTPTREKQREEEKLNKTKQNKERKKEKHSRVHVVELREKVVFTNWFQCDLHSWLFSIDNLRLRHANKASK